MSFSPLTRLHSIAVRIVDSHVALRWIFVFIACAVAIQFILPIWWALQSDKVITEPTPPRATFHGKQVGAWEAGQIVSLERELCANKSYAGTLLRTLWGNGAMPLPHEAIVLNAGCHILRTYIVLPAYLLPGEYVLQSSVQIQLNPLRTVTITLQSIPMIVKASPVTSELDQIRKDIRVLTTEHARIRSLQKATKAIDAKQEKIQVRQDRILQYLIQMDTWVKSELEKAQRHQQENQRQPR